MKRLSPTAREYVESVGCILAGLPVLAALIIAADYIN